MRRPAAVLALLLAAACGSSPSGEAPPTRAEPPSPQTAAPPPATPPPAAATATGAAAAALPPDGKYENVLVEGKRVPMVQVMNGGEVLLVDVDGKKPRTWEEQYKRKSIALKPGQFDLHKTDANRDGRFENDDVDRQGRWQTDASANLSAY